jgi:hypothetical protein
VHLEQFLGDRGGPRAEPAVRLLQGDDIRIDLVQHVDDPTGIAPPVGTYCFVNIVTGNLDHRGRFIRSERIDAIALLLQQGVGGHRGKGHLYARQQVGIGDAMGRCALAAEIE